MDGAYAESGGKGFGGKFLIVLPFTFSSSAAVASDAVLIVGDTLFTMHFSHF